MPDYCNTLTFKKNAIFYLKQKNPTTVFDYVYISNHPVIFIEFQGFSSFWKRQVDICT